MSLAHFAALGATPDFHHGLPGRWSARRRSTLACIVLVWTASAAVGCGKKGPPLAPLTPLPNPAANISVRRIDDEVFITFTIPTTNRNAPGPADLARMEVYAYTSLQPLSEAEIELESEASLVGAEAVRPPEPPAPPPKPGASPTPTPTRTPARPPGLDQGAAVTMVDKLDAAARTVFTPKTTDAPRPPMLPSQGPAPAPLGFDTAPTPSRYYIIVSVSTKGRRTAAARSVVSLASAPQAPAAPSVTYTAQALLVAWTPPADVAPPSLPPPADVLPSTPLPPPPPPLKYIVYETTSPRAGEAKPGAPTPLNPAPIETASLETPLVSYGIERCFLVRAVVQSVNSIIEGPASPPACVDVRDTFGPAAPANLQAVGGAGAISLIWQPNTEADLAGYLVLRADSPGATLQVLTPSPIRETTYRDTTVQPNVRYAYVVVAVDGAAPPNRSAPSNRVEETAR